MTNLNHLREIATEIQDIIEANPDAKQNEQVVKQLVQLTHQLKGTHSSVSEKAHLIATRAPEYYSIRKYEKYSGGTDYLYSRLLGWSGTILDVIDRLERIEKTKTEKHSEA